MPERFDPDAILARNPQLDRDSLAEAREIDRNLHEMGVQRKGYDIVSPFKRRPAPPTPAPQPSPRLAGLKKAPS